MGNYTRCLKCGKRFYARYSKSVYCFECYKNLTQFTNNEDYLKKKSVKE